MKIIGINHDMFISSAALLEDGKIIAAAAEERFTRQKHTRQFPRHAIQYCLHEANCTIEEIDFFASSWNPGVYFKKFNPLLSSKRRWKGEYLYAVPDQVLSLYGQEKKEVDFVKQEIHLFDSTCTIYYITHHRAHAANAFLISPFEEAAILTADSQGELEATTFAYGQGHHIEHIKSLHYPQSLGAFYSTVTEYLGYQANSHEWKVMAMASFGESNNAYYKQMKEKIFTLLPDGEYEFDLTYLQGYNNEEPNLYSEKWVELFGPPRHAEEEITERHYQIAAALQQASEEIAFHLLQWLHHKTKRNNLALSGGFFMNSVFNGKVLSHTPFEHCFISSCPDDSGNAIGAACYLYNHILNQPVREEMKHNYLGPEWTKEEMQNVISKYGLKAEYVEQIEERCATLLCEGKLLGWFQGRMEFGQRALGNRSILADPRSSETKDRVNLAVKYREAYRPFAPAILKEEVENFFIVDHDENVPFMEKVFLLREEKRSLLPAVCHVDGTGRLQTVCRDTNPKFHALIHAFYEKTGVPVILNTSFNLNGEPIVCTPTDAIRTFYSCGLDGLALGNYLVLKT